MLIGFTGKKRHGKDTAGKVLQSYGFSHLSLADPMRTIVEDIYSRLGIDDDRIDEYLYGDRKQEVVPEIGCTTRHVMQTLGTEWGRDCINIDLWIKILVSTATSEPDQHFYVTDVRFHNEGACVRDGGGCMIRIFNPRVLDDEFSAHPSERDILSMEVYAEIINDTTVADLHGKVIDVVSQFAESRGLVL